MVQPNWKLFGGNRRANEWRFLVLSERFWCNGFSVFDTDLVLRNCFDHLRVNLAFRFKDPFLQRVGRIARKDFHGTLSDDWAMVELVVDKVNGAARYFAALIQDSLMNSVPIKSLTGERGDQAGVNVDHTIFKIIWNQHMLEKNRP